MNPLYNQGNGYSRCGRVTLESEKFLIGETPLNIANGNKINDDEEDHENILQTSVLPLDVIQESPQTEILHDFSIMTYNVLQQVNRMEGADHMEFIKLRVNAITKAISKSNPDILCIQGMTDMSSPFLKGELSRMYPYSFADNLKVSMFSKYRPLSMKLYGIGAGTSGSKMMVLEFQNIIVINCYLRESQPWCKREELKVIGSLVDIYFNNGKGCILAGDFSCHLGGNLEEWPEIRGFANMKMKDVWTQLRYDNPGFTEDTDINQMQWNTKFKQRKLRYDGIFYRNPSDNPILKPIEVKLTGRKPVIMSRQSSEKFIEYFVPAGSNHHNDIIYFDMEDHILALWPSDHFAVFATFEVLDERITVGEDLEATSARDIPNTEQPWH
jgi:hypothetical protein